MSKAIELAAWLNEGSWHQMRLGDVEAAGRELRRLDAENEALRISIKYEESENQKDFDALRAELAAVRKDAARYRFLRDNPYFQIEYTGELTLDEHVDSEMEKTNE
jgi:hypothetical protein